jgi:glycosyltransferase 2 family protein
MKTIRSPVVRAFAGVGALAIFVSVLVHADWRGATTLLAAAGPKVFVALVPFAVIMAVDARVQQTLFRRLGISVAFRRLYPVRIVTEAVTMSLPAGVLFAETSGPLFIERHCGVRADQALVVNAAKRWLTIRAHSFYLVLSVVLGYGALARAFPTTFGLRAVVGIICGTSVGLFAASLAIGAVFRGRRWPGRAVAFLRALPFARLGVWLDSKERAIDAIDQRLGELGGAKRTQTWVTAMLVGAWVLESVDTWLILRMLGAPLDFTDVIAFEAALSVVRSAVFFVPAGLGFQDLGYVTFFVAVGIPDAAALGAAFVALKRAKEIVWIIVGVAIGAVVATARSRASRPAVSMHKEVLS